MKVSLIVVLAILTPAAAIAGPAGKWRVGDGTAHVQIRPCGEALCGSIVWAADGGGLDENNPDPAQRGRKLIGLPILHLQKNGDNLWAGSVYNAQNGQNYSAKLTMIGDSTLTLEGCVLGTNLCGAENWARTK